MPTNLQQRDEAPQEPKRREQVLLEPSVIAQVERLARERSKAFGLTVTKSAMYRLLILNALEHESH